MLAAATIKASYWRPYGDAFAIATAQAYGAVLMTGDPEMLQPGMVSLTEDLR